MHFNGVREISGHSDAKAVGERVGCQTLMIDAVFKSVVSHIRQVGE